MNIVLMEPLSVSAQTLERFSAPLKQAGHSITAYDTFAVETEEMIARAKNADVLMIANHPLPDAVIEACPKLRYISVAFVGIDHVGQTACKARDIHISNAAGYCRDAVAELALGLALDCLRNISACNNVVRKGGTKVGLVGHELSGRTVGIVGTGDTGIRTAQLYKAFGCRVLGYSRSQRQLALDSGVEYVSLEQLLQMSDIVSVHTPLNENTRNLINAERVAMMKPGAILVNTSRGPVVESQAVADALKAGHLAALGTDVFETEPPVPEDHPFFGAPNVVATPHVAFATIESLERRAAITFDNVVKWMAGTLQNQML